MHILSDGSFLQKLRDEDNASFEVLYEFYFPPVIGYITNHCGSVEDAEDVFQESVMVLLHKIRQPDFLLTSSLKTYLFAISKNLWLKRLRDNKLLPVADLEKYQPEATVLSIEIIPEITNEEKVNSWLSKITAHCRIILKAIFYYKEPMDSLMKKLGWKNRHTAANQQYKCIQQVKKQKDKEEGSR